MSQYEVTFAGFGGQGIMVAGQLLAQAGINEGKNVVWIPSYGPEMRGGTAYCTVVVSDSRIGSPIIPNPMGACVFNRPSLDKFGPKIRPNGLLVINSSLIDVKSDRDDILQLLVPANNMALEAGNARATNVAMLGAFVGATGIVSYDTLVSTLKQKLGKKQSMLEINLKVIEQGFALANDRLGKKAHV